MWYDKYFHFWQRKNVYDVYLKQEGYTQLVVVVLENGLKGESYLPSSEENNLGSAIRDAYCNATKQIEDKKSDYELYLKPTLEKIRPDPALVSYIEKGYIPRYTNGVQPKTDPEYNLPQGEKK